MKARNNFTLQNDVFHKNSRKYKKERNIPKALVITGTTKLMQNHFGNDLITSIKLACKT